MERNDTVPVALEEAIGGLATSLAGTGAKVTLFGGLAVVAYGMTDRQTHNVNAEISAVPTEAFKVAVDALEKLGIPAYLTANASRWSMIDLPSGYRERTVLFRKVGDVTFHLPSPVDLIVSKIRVGRDRDIADSEYIAKRFGIRASEIRAAAESAVRNSPSSTEVPEFRNRLDLFEKTLEGDDARNPEDRKRRPDRELGE
jgi:hypothetical protein